MSFLQCLVSRNPNIKYIFNDLKKVECFFLALQFRPVSFSTSSIRVALSFAQIHLLTLTYFQVKSFFVGKRKFQQTFVRCWFSFAQDRIKSFFLTLCLWTKVFNLYLAVCSKSNFDFFGLTRLLSYCVVSGRFQWSHKFSAITNAINLCVVTRIKWVFVSFVFGEIFL